MLTARAPTTLTVQNGHMTSKIVPMLLSVTFTEKIEEKGTDWCLIHKMTWDKNKSINKKGENLQATVNALLQ